MLNTGNRFTCYRCKSLTSGPPTIVTGRLYCPFCSPNEQTDKGPFIEVQCGNCLYDFVGSVASSMPTCPKCGGGTLPLAPYGYDDGIDETWDELRQELWPEELEEESFW